MLDLVDDAALRIGASPTKLRIARVGLVPKTDAVVATPLPPAHPGLARAVPWILFAVELVITVVVIGILSVILFVQLTLTPGAILGEFDDFLTWTVSLGITAVAEVVGSLALFGATGLVVGILGLPVRFIGPLRRAWLRHGEVTLIGIGLGILAIAAAYIFGTWSTVTGNLDTYDIYSPNPWPLLVGWLLLAFSLSMVVWPVGWLPRRAREWWIATQCTKRLPTAS
jgi:hypothetical protein